MRGRTRRLIAMGLLGNRGESYNPEQDARLELNWDFSDPATLFQNINGTHTTAVANDADPIGYVADKKSSNPGWTNDNTRRPLYKTNRQNGLSTALFDGSNDFLSTNSGVDMTRNQPRTVFIVMKQTGWTHNDCIFSGDRSGGDVMEAVQWNNLANPGITTYAGAAFTKYFNPGTSKFNILWFVFNGTSSIKGMNKGVYVTGAAGASNGTAFRLGALGVAGTGAANIEVGQVMDFAGALSLTDIGKVVDWLNAKWGCFTAEEGAAEYDADTTYQSYFNAPLHTQDGLNNLRTYLRGLIWPGGYPSAGMTTSDDEAADPLTASPSNLDHVTLHTITLTDPDTAATINPVRSIYVWFPTAGTTNNKFVIVHKGHDDTFNERNLGTLIKSLVEAGYTVAGVSMPMEPDDTWTLHTGTMYAITDATEFQWFLDPTIRVINHYVGTFSTFYMTGISGGGWSTTMMAAIDPRISRAADIAGTIPFYCYANRSDQEQKLFNLGLEYSDLYTMACTGSRQLKQVLIANDPITFTQAMYNVKPYETAVQAYAAGFSLLIDSSTSTHEISAAVQTAVLNMFNAA